MIMSKWISWMAMHIEDAVDIYIKSTNGEVVLKKFEHLC